MEMNRFIQFFDGQRIPVVGLGTGKIIDTEEIEKTMDKALELGYRLFDTATGYKNESGIGKALKKWMDNGKVTRDEIFLVTKLPLIGMHPDKVGHFIEISLQNLQVQFIDLYLIHWPIGLTYVNDNELMPRDKDGELLLDLETNLEGIWKVLESHVNSGKVKALGLSNFNEQQIQRVINVCEIRPAVSQIELHVNFQQRKLREFCCRQKIAICGYAPLGSPGRRNYINANTMKIPRLLEDPVVSKISKLHGKSPAQVVLRYLIQELRIAVIPKSTNALRLKENMDVFDFELDSDEIIDLRELDQGEDGRSCPSFDGAKLHPECPF